MKGKYLINTDMWFTAPDGKDYKAVWGEVEVLQTKEVWGFEPLRPSQNWFLKVGTDDNHVLIAGCQIHYAVKCEVRPYSGNVFKDYGEGEKNTDCKIYFADSSIEIKNDLSDKKVKEIGFINIFNNEKE